MWIEWLRVHLYQTHVSVRVKIWNIQLQQLLKRDSVIHRQETFFQVEFYMLHANSCTAIGSICTEETVILSNKTTRKYSGRTAVLIATNFHTACSQTTISGENQGRLSVHYNFLSIFCGIVPDFQSPFQPNPCLPSFKMWWLDWFKLKYGCKLCIKGNFFYKFIAM